MRVGEYHYGWDILLRPGPDAPLPLVGVGRLLPTSEILPFLPNPLARDDRTLVPLHVAPDAWLLAEGRYSEGIAGMHALAARPDGSVLPGDPRFYRRAGIALALRARDGILFARRSPHLRTNPSRWCVAAGEGMTVDDLGYDVRQAARRAALEEWDLDLSQDAFALLALARHRASTDCVAFLLADVSHRTAADLCVAGAAAPDAWERDATHLFGPGPLRPALEALAAGGPPPTPASLLMAALLDA